MDNYIQIHKKPISLVIAIIILCGIYFYSQIRISLFPEITFPKIKVIAENGEQTVDKMMVSVTVPLENAIKSIPDLQILRSTTSRGSCEISAFLKWKSDINFNLQILQTRIDEIKNDLPPTTEIKVELMNPSLLPVIGFNLESNTKTPIELNLLAKYTVKPYFAGIDGIMSVDVMGGKTKEYWLIPDLQKMSTFAVTPDIIQNILSQTNFINSNGYLSDYHRMYLTTLDASLYNLHDIENVIIKNDTKRIIRLKDIARIEVHEKVEYNKINANGKQSVLVNIKKQPNANLIDLASDVMKKKEGLQKILPKGVTLNTYYNQAEFVDDSIKSVSDCVWIGLLLSVFVAVLFLRSFRASATILITIPVTLFLSTIILFAFGYTLNIMTLGAIAAAIGLIIDDTIVVVEQIHRMQEETPETEDHTTVHYAIRYLFPSMLGSTLSTTVIFVPFFLLSGVAGAYFHVLTNTMIIILLCSFFVTWLGLPIIYLVLPTGKKLFNSKQSQANRIAKHGIWVSYVIRKPVISLLFITFLILSVIFALPKLQTGFLPEMDEGSIVLDYTSPPGTSLEETDRILQQVEKIIKNVPEFESYSRRTGLQMGFFITEPNYGDYLIKLKNKRKRTTVEVIDDIRNKIKSTQPALIIDFGQVIGDMLGDLMASVQPIEIKVFGDDQNVLHDLSRQVGSEIEKIPGVADVFNGITIAGPSVDIKPDIPKLTQFGLTPAGFQFQVKSMLEGNIMGSIQEKDQYTNIRMIYPYNIRSGLEKLKKQMIFLPNGKLREITEFASISMKPGIAEIKRENLKSAGIITARLNNRDMGSVMKDIQKVMKSKITMPEGYYYSYGGSYKEQQKSFDELLMILIISSLLVFTLILFLYKNFRVALVILFVSVLGVAGSVLGLYIFSVPLNVGSYTGIIMIVGIIAENAIFTFQQFHTKLAIANVSDSLSFAISTRLRPKLMTAFGTIIALSPLALGIGTGAQMHQPLAIAVIGGLVVAIPLLLIVYPSLLKLFYKHNLPIH